MQSTPHILENMQKKPPQVGDRWGIKQKESIHE